MMMMMKRMTTAISYWLFLTALWNMRHYPHLQNLSLREAKWSAQGHTASEQLSTNMTPSWPAPKVYVLRPHTGSDSWPWERSRLSIPLVLLPLQPPLISYSMTSVSMKGLRNFSHKPSARQPGSQANAVIFSLSNFHVAHLELFLFRAKNTRTNLFNFV